MKKTKGVDKSVLPSERSVIFDNNAHGIGATTPVDASFTKNNKPPKRTAWWRLLLVLIFGFIAFNAFMGGIVALWATRTLFNTEAFTSVVGGLPRQPEIRSMLVEKTSDIIVDSIPQEELVRQLNLPVVPGAAAEQLKNQVATTVESTVQQIIASPSFADRWEIAVRQAHMQLLEKLKNGQEAAINLRPLIIGIVDQLKGTPLEYLYGQIKIPQDAGVIHIQGDQFKNLQRSYNLAEKSYWLLLGTALVATVLMLWVASKKLIALRRLFFTMLLATALVFATLTLVPGYVRGLLGTKDADTLQTATTLTQQFTHELARINGIAATIAALIVLATTLLIMRQKRAAHLGPQTEN